MIKRYKLILISVFALIATVCLFAGCRLNVSFDEVIKDNELTGGQMTYFINVGDDEGAGAFEDNLQIKEMYYKKGTKPFNIGIDKLDSGSCKLSDNYGFSFIGWYVVDTNAEGVPLYEDGTPYSESDDFNGQKHMKIKTDADGKPIPFDFNTVFQDGEHYYVCSRWFKEARLNVKLITDGYDVLEKDGKEYRTGDIISYYVFRSENGVNKPSNPFTASGYTFLSFHADESGETEYTGWPMTKPEDGSDATIYAKYIKGDWSIVRNASDVISMFGNGVRGNYYFFNSESESKVIDCDGVTVLQPTLLSGKIVGNNFTVKNLNVGTANALGNNSVASIFGNVSGAEICDITFENVGMNLTVRSNADPAIHFVFSSIDEASKIENVTVGGELTINLGRDSKVSRTTATNWLFGGCGQDSNYTNITVSAGTKCTIYNSDKTVFAEYVK